MSTATRTPTRAGSPRGADQRSFRFGTGAAPGLWLGLSAARVAVLGLGVLIATGLLIARAGFAVAVLPLAGAAVVTLVPVAGRPLAGWLAPLLGHVSAAINGSLRWRGPLPTLAIDHVLNTTASTNGAAAPAAVVSPTARRSPVRLDLPHPFGPAWLSEATDELTGAPIGMLTDAARGPRSSSVTVTFRIAGPDRFGLLDTDGQDRLLLGWGRVLSAFAAPERQITHLQLLERVAVGETDVSAASDWADARARRAERTGRDPYDIAQDKSYEDLPGMVGVRSLRRDSVLSVRLARRAGDPHATATHTDSDAELLARLRDVAMDLLTAELVARPLGADELHDLFARMLQPGRSAAAPDARTVRGAALSCRTRWDEVRIDDATHRGYAVTGWPASPVPARWLSTLTGPAPQVGARTLAVHLAPMPAAVAARIARAARARAELDRADRRRFGLSASAADDHAAYESASMEAELVAGHATHRIAAVLSCSTADGAELGRASRGLRDAGTGAGLTLRPLHGQHQHALTATLPLCRLRFGGAA